MKTEKIILYLTCMKSTKYGAIEHYLVGIAKECSKYNRRIIIQYEEVPRSRAYLEDLENNGVKVVTSRFMSNSVQAIKGLLKLVETSRPDIIQTCFPNRFVLLATPMIAKYMGIHKTISMVLSMGHLSKASILSKFAYSRYDHIICISKEIAENLIVAGVNKKIISSHYMGVFGHVSRSEKLRDEIRNQLAVRHDDVVLACIAFDTYFKGLDILLEAFRNECLQFKNIHLMVIGVEPYQSDLPQLAKRLDICKYVHWMGIHDEGWQFLNAADIYIQPSRFAEGLSLATIEAMALQLPVVATRVAGPAELVMDGETGYLCSPDDVKSLGRTISKMLRHRERWDKMGQLGYARYKKMLTGERSVEELVQNYYLS